MIFLLQPGQMSSIRDVTSATRWDRVRVLRICLEQTNAISAQRIVGNALAVR